MIGKFKVLLQISLRNLFASPMNIIVGLIILFGVFFIVIIASILESMDEAMSKSLVGSVAGDVQVYSDNSKEEFSLFGGMMGEDSDVGVFDSYAKLEKALKSVPNVDKVVPMGVGGALITSGNTIDLTLAELRDSVKELKGKGASPELTARIASQKDHVQQLIRVLQQDRTNAKAALSDKPDDPEVTAALEKVGARSFWDGFNANPFDALELLENKIAPLIADADMQGIRYAGTDFTRYRAAFPALEVVQGEVVPPGHRGLLIPAFFYEEILKLKTARRLDKIKSALSNGRKIEGDPELERFVRENETQVREIIFQLDNLKTQRLAKSLSQYLSTRAPTRLAERKKKLGEKIRADVDVFRLGGWVLRKGTQGASLKNVEEAHADDRKDVELKKQSATVEKHEKVLSGLGDKNATAALPELLSIFLFTDDANFQERHDYFYKEIAPLLQLYRVRVGDLFTIRAFTKSGSMQAVNLKIYGTFQFKGLEKSPLAGLLALMDMVSFRELYGHLTAEKLAELKTLKERAGVKDVSREQAEDALFGAGSMIVEGASASIAEEAELGRFERNEFATRTFDQKEVDDGVVLNASVILKDKRKAEQSEKDIIRAGKEAGLKLRAVPWHKAAGLFGQFVQFSKFGLYVAVAIMFVVALAVIILAMMIATMQRIGQIGTLRAIGAQRSFVLSMVLTETVVVGTVFGFLGMGLGALVVTGLASQGIPAPNEELYFFFSGPRLYPSVHPQILIAAFIAILITCTLSALYPARIATRVSPLRAMQTED
ncbi:MAG: ABC transporter permease [Myxococcaceae bacterium]